MASNDQWPPVASSSTGKGPNRRRNNRKKNKDFNNDNKLFVIDSLTEMFYSTINFHDIQSIAQNCDYDLESATEALIALSASMEDSEKRTHDNEEIIQMNDEEFKEQLRNFAIFESLNGKYAKNHVDSVDSSLWNEPDYHLDDNQASPGLKAPNFFDKSPQMDYNPQSPELSGLKVHYRRPGVDSTSEDDDADVVVEDEVNTYNNSSKISVNVSQFLSSTNQTTTQSSPRAQTTTTASPPNTPRRTVYEATLNRVKDAIRRGEKLLVILRGLPGSGKSTLAMSIISTTIGSLYSSQHIFSTDDYFSINGVFRFDPSRLGDAHNWNQCRARMAFGEGKTPVIIDNTNLEDWEMLPYAAMAVEQNYTVEVLETNTPWAGNVNELYRRNTHGVPKEKITRMKQKYERGITGEKLLNIFSLKYPLPKVSEDFLADTTKDERNLRQNTSSEESLNEENDSEDSHLLQPLGAIGSERKSSLVPSEVTSPSREPEDSDHESKENVLSQCWDFTLKLNGRTFHSYHRVDDHLSREKMRKQDKEFGKQKAWEPSALLGKSPSSFAKKKSKPKEMNEFIEALTKSYKDTVSSFDKKKSTVIITEIIDHEASISVEKAAVLGSDGGRAWVNDVSTPLPGADVVVEAWNLKENPEKGSTSIDNTDKTDAAAEPDPILIDLINQEDVISTNDKRDLWDDLLPTPLPTDYEVDKWLRRESQKKNSLIIDNTDKTDATSRPDPDLVNQESVTCPDDAWSCISPSLSTDILEKSSLIRDIDDSDAAIGLNLALNDDNEIVDNLNRITWKESSFPKACPPIIDEKFRKEPPSMSDASTCTTYYDFNVAYMGGDSTWDYRVIDAHSRHITEGLIPIESKEPWRKLMLDKSSMTGGNPEDEEPEDRIAELEELFPDHPRDHLTELYTYCKKDFNWTVEVLLDGAQPDSESVKDQDDGIDVKSDAEIINTAVEEKTMTIEDEPDLSEAKDDTSDEISSASTSSGSRSKSQEYEKNAEAEEIMELNLGFDFIRSLENQFGNSDFQLPEGFQPVIQIKKSMAEKLYGLWIESMYQQINTRHEELDRMIARDAEYAKLLEQELEQESVDVAKPEDAGQSDVPNLQEIMKMERARKNGKCSPELDDIASRLSRQMLYESLPDIHPETLNEILKAHHNNFKETFEVIKSSTGRSVTPGTFGKKPKSLAERVAESDTRSTTPTQSPKKNFEYKNALKNMNNSRKEAQLQFSLRVENINKAADAYRRGYPGVAAYYSEVARLNMQNIQAAEMEAASALVEAQIFGENEDTLDLHYLHVAEALYAIDEFLRHHLTKLSKGSKKTSVIYIITGRGARSNNQMSRIKPAVSKELLKRKIRFSELNPGCLKVTLRKTGATD